MKESFSLFIFCILALSFIGGCATVTPVQSAFQGALPATEETKVIVDYCQSCHVHRDFASEAHLKVLPGKYTAEPFKSATSCKTCHSITTNFWGDIARSTIVPSGRLINE